MPQLTFSVFSFNSKAYTSWNASSFSILRASCRPLFLVHLNFLYPSNCCSHLVKHNHIHFAFFLTQADLEEFIFMFPNPSWVFRTTFHPVLVLVHSLSHCITEYCKRVPLSLIPCSQAQEIACHSFWQKWRLLKLLQLTFFSLYDCFRNDIRIVCIVKEEYAVSCV